MRTRLLLAVLVPLLTAGSILAGGGLQGPNGQPVTATEVTRAYQHIANTKLLIDTMKRVGEPELVYHCTNWWNHWRLRYRTEDDRRIYAVEDPTKAVNWAAMVGVYAASLEPTGGTALCARVFPKKKLEAARDALDEVVSRLEFDLGKADTADDGRRSADELRTRLDAARKALGTLLVEAGPGGRRPQIQRPFLAPEFAQAIKTATGIDTGPAVGGSTDVTQGTGGTTDPIKGTGGDVMSDAGQFGFDPGKPLLDVAVDEQKNTGGSLTTTTTKDQTVQNQSGIALLDEFFGAGGTAQSQYVGDVAGAYQGGDVSTMQLCQIPATWTDKGVPFEQIPQSQDIFQTGGPSDAYAQLQGVPYGDFVYPAGDIQMPPATQQQSGSGGTFSFDAWANQPVHDMIARQSGSETAQALAILRARSIERVRAHHPTWTRAQCEAYVDKFMSTILTVSPQNGRYPILDPRTHRGPVMVVAGGSGSVSPYPTTDQSQYPTTDQSQYPTTDQSQYPSGNPTQTPYPTTGTQSGTTGTTTNPNGTVTNQQLLRDAQSEANELRSYSAAVFPASMDQAQPTVIAQYLARQVQTRDRRTVVAVDAMLADCANFRQNLPRSKLQAVLGRNDRRIVTLTNALASVEAALREFKAARTDQARLTAAEHFRTAARAARTATAQLPNIQA